MSARSTHTHAYAGMLTCECSGPFLFDPLKLELEAVVDDKHS